MSTPIPAPTPAQIEAYRAELARGGLTPDDLDPETRNRLIRVRVVEPVPTFEQHAAPTNWGMDYSDIRPGMAPGTKRIPGIHSGRT
jgi:hypothetical protein